MTSKNRILVPKDLTIIYSPRKDILTILGPREIKSVKLPFKIIIKMQNRHLVVTSIPAAKRVSVDLIKKIPGLKGKTISLIKSKMLETQFCFYTRLKLVGVGYRALIDYPEKPAENFKMKLGYSHLVYYKLPDNFKIRCYKYTKFTLYGTEPFCSLAQIASKVRSHKKPEPYKGKGILYSNEKINLKIGKRV